MKTAYKVCVSTGAAMTLALSYAIIPAQASPRPASSPLVSSLKAATPATLAAATDQRVHAQQLTVYGLDSTTTLSLDPKRGVSLKGNKNEVKIGLPSANKAAAGKELTPGVISYSNGDGSTTAAVAVGDGSVQFNTVIATPSAPSTYTYPMTTPNQSRVTLNRAGGVDITDSRGRWIAGIAPAWAKDAKGTAVKTWYSLKGSTLTQHVDTHVAGLTFPVVADPFLGMSFIDHTTWANTWQYSPTLQIFPTTWGRIAPVWDEDAAWNEALSKTVTAGYPDPTTPSMRTQFNCHWQAVRFVSPNKPSWDLDSKLPNTSLINEISHGCNYGSN